MDITFYASLNSTQEGVDLSDVFLLGSNTEYPLNRSGPTTTANVALKTKILTTLP
jgi:hypothetical protein